MDRNTIIGLTLIFLVFLAWQQFLTPSAEELAEQQRQDSLRIEQQRLDSIAKVQSQLDTTTTADTLVNTIPDSVKVAGMTGAYGAFAPSAVGKAEDVLLENDVFRITFTSKGGRIKEVLLKKYFEMSGNDETQEPLLLMDDENNRFEYLLPVPGTSNGTVATSELYFDVQKKDDAIIFRADAGNGRYFEQRYAIAQGSYTIDYSVRFVGLQNIIAADAPYVKLNWVNYLNKLERNVDYERRFSSVYFKPVGDDVDYCSCTSDDVEELDDESLAWISHSNQFFNSALVASEVPFDSGVLATEMLPEGSEPLKKLTSELNIPYERAGGDLTFPMEFYIGPKDYKLLSAFDNGLEYTIPYGWSIFGTVNRWVIRPVFDFLSRFIGSKGIVILILTLVIKLILYPLSYRMLYSQAKMGALKPRLANLREKYKDDSQKQQMETMKIYREFGVNPLGGCLPMVLQMPIWFALYRFFPAAIEFRQASFLWATDLSSYDVFLQLPFEIPFYGAHVSLFTLLWAITTVIYTFYNSQQMDMTANPAMKYMQYFMPIMFIFFFNNFASGLTCYLLFSNLFNISQTIITKNYIINHDKIKEELEAYKKKPKKKGGFQERLENALKEQQKVQEQRQKGKSQGKNRRKKK